MCARQSAVGWRRTRHRWVRTEGSPRTGRPAVQRLVDGGATAARHDERLRDDCRRSEVGPRIVSDPFRPRRTIPGGASGRSRDRHASLLTAVIPRCDTPVVRSAGEAGSEGGQARAGADATAPVGLSGGPDVVTIWSRPWLLILKGRAPYKSAKWRLQRYGPYLTHARLLYESVSGR